MEQVPQQNSALMEGQNPALMQEPNQMQTVTIEGTEYPVRISQSPDGQIIKSVVYTTEFPIVFNEDGKGMINAEGPLQGKMITGGRRRSRRTKRSRKSKQSRRSRRV